MIPICLPSNDNSLVGEVSNVPEFLCVFFKSVHYFLIPKPFSFYTSFQVGTVTGWGRLSEYGQISPVLREVQLPIISNSKCMRMYR